MDPSTARLECLRLAAAEHQPGDADAILEAAKKWSEFVIGAPVREHKGQGEKGRDDPK